MTIVVGIAPGHSSSSAVHLGALLARSMKLELVIAAVTATGWPLAFSRGDQDYQDRVVAQAEATLAEALALVPTDVTARTLVHQDPSSVRQGLIDVVEAVGGQRLVVGAAKSSPIGRISLGSVDSGLMQTSPVPVAIAPRGFRLRDGQDIEQITAAYRGTEADSDLILGAATIAAESDLRFRIASFAVRPRRMATSGVGQDYENEVFEEWRQTLLSDANAALESAATRTELPKAAEVVLGIGDDWDEAMAAVDWNQGDVLVIGSSSSGPFARVTLGSHARKIVHHAVVPVIVVPRRAAEEYAAGGEF